MTHRLGFWAIAAIFIGIATGLFFGEATRALEPIGDTYIMLLQMVGLPYIAFSLMHGLGSVAPKIGKRLLKKGWVYLLILWLSVFAIIYLLAVLIPEPVSTFYGYLTGHQPSLAHRFLSFIIPQNPFYDLANNIVPAIAIFGCIVGAAIMHLKQKEPLLGLLERVNTTIEEILTWLAIIAPIGIFAHISVAFGTVDFNDLLKLDFYIVAFIVATLFLTFFILPILISNLTPLTYREILREFRVVCFLPFATGIPTIAFPFIIKSVKRIGKMGHFGNQQFHSASQTVVPLSFSFAQIGNCLTLFFMLFIAFYYRHPLQGFEQLLLPLLMIPMSFGMPTTSISSVSFLIDEFHFPKEAFRLFTETLSITLNFQVLLSVAGMLTFTYLALFAYYGKLKVQWHRLFVRILTSFAVLAGVVFFIKPFLSLTDHFKDLYMRLSIQEAIPHPVKTTIYTEENKPAPPVVKEIAGVFEPLQRILSKGVLRIGYDTRNIPFCYHNQNGEIIGYDMAYAYQLARDLDCQLELIPMDINHFDAEVNADLYDIAMSAILMDEQRLEKMEFTHSYLEQDNVLVVPESKRKEFHKLSNVVEDKGLKIAGGGAYANVVERHFPNATVVHNGKEALLNNTAEAVVWSHIPAYVWCLDHPEFAVIDYDFLLGKRYFSYPVKQGAYDWASFINNWLSLKEQTGFHALQYGYWIEGKPIADPSPRWCIIRNVLHWIQ